MLHLTLFQAAKEAQKPWNSLLKQVTQLSCQNPTTHLSSQNPETNSPFLLSFPTKSKPEIFTQTP